jgi:ABC-2 type transport system ATP-binding protein
MASPAPAIRTEKLTKHYGKTVGIEDLALEVRGGEIFGFLGANGAGKTTTLRLLMGLLRPTAGGASVLGKDPWRDGVRVREHIGYLPGELRLYGHLTGAQTLDRLGALYPAPPALRAELCRRLELPGEALARKTSTYSRGMKQKLGLILALQHDPELLVLDEPTEGLDPMMRVELKTVLRAARDRGRTIFFSTHNLAEAEEMCDRVGIVRGGKLVAVEAVSDLAARRLHRVEVEFTDGVPGEALGALAGVTVEEHEGRRVRLRAAGDLAPLLKLLGEQRLAGLEIHGTTIEDLFLEHYRAKETAP